MTISSEVDSFDYIFTSYAFLSQLIFLTITLYEMLLFFIFLFMILVINYSKCLGDIWGLESSNWIYF